MRLSALPLLESLGHRPTGLLLVFSVMRYTLYMADAVYTKHVQQSFGTKDAARYSGVSKVMVDYLCRIKLVEPQCACPRGHGRPRHYSFGDLVALRMVDQLCKTGISVVAIGEALSRLQTLYPMITLGTLPAKQLVFDGKALLLHNEGAPLERIFDGQVAFGFVVEIAKARDAVVELMPTEVVEEVRKWA